MADPNVNTQAEILANVRNKALEDCALIAEGYNSDGNAIVATLIAERIRKLKTPEKS